MADQFAKYGMKVNYQLQPGDYLKPQNVSCGNEPHHPVAGITVQKKCCFFRIFLIFKFKIMKICELIRGSLILCITFW